MSLRCVLGLVIVCAGRRADAGRSIVVDVIGAPFAPAELADAIRVRVAAEGEPLRLRVTAIDHGVRVEARGGVRDVDLGDLHGAAAARLIALAAGDLLFDDLAIPPAVEPRAERTLGVVGNAAAWDGVLGGITLDLALPRGAWLVAIEAGGGEVVGGEVGAVAGVVRIGAGYRTGWLELRAGATAVPLLVTTGAGDRTVLLGGGASARIRIPIADGLRGLVIGGVDAFANRTHYQVAGMPAMTTPWWAPWIAAGVEVTL